jgi:hypothetical protein
MSDGFVAINEWEYTFVNQKLRLFNKDLKNLLVKACGAFFRSEEHHSTKRITTQ